MKADSLDTEEAAAAPHLLASSLVGEDAGCGTGAAGAEVCPAGVTRDLKLTRPLGLRLRSGHVVINGDSFHIFLRDNMCVLLLREVINES